MIGMPTIPGHFPKPLNRFPSLASTFTVCSAEEAGTINDNDKWVSSFATKASYPSTKRPANFHMAWATRTKAVISQCTSIISLKPLEAFNNVNTVNSRSAWNGWFKVMFKIKGTPLFPSSWLLASGSRRIQHPTPDSTWNGNDVQPSEARTRPISTNILIFIRYGIQP